MKTIVVLYHANCPDGFGAAYAAWKKFGNSADYAAISPQELPLRFPKNKDVYVLDSSYAPKELQRLVKANKSVTIIDHHISSKENVQKAPRYVFDVNHSGAVLSWRFFHPQKSVPTLLRYIEEADLWKWKMLFSLDISMYLASQDFNFKIWDKLARDLSKKQNLKMYASYGRIILQYSDQIVEEIVRKADLVRFEGRLVLAANSSSKKLTSALGHRLYEKRPPLGIVWYEEKGVFRISLRSNGRVDVSKIAGKYGGGGHKEAAGFTLRMEKGLPWKIIKQ